MVYVAPDYPFSAIHSNCALSPALNDDDDALWTHLELHLVSNNCLVSKKAGLHLTVAADAAVTCHFKLPQRQKNLKMRVGGFNLNQLGDKKERVFYAWSRAREIRDGCKGDKGISE